MIKLLATFISDTGSLPRCHLPPVSLHGHFLCGEGSRVLCTPYEDTFYLIRDPPIGPHLTLITSIKVLSPNTVTLGFGSSTYEYGRDRIQPIT